MGNHALMANFEIYKETNEYILLKDIGPWDQHRTITNDAETVVYALRDRVRGRLLFYIDSSGDIDRLVIDAQGRFCGFRRQSPPGYGRNIKDPNPNWKPSPHSRPRAALGDRHQDAFWNSFRKNNPDWNGD